MALIIRGKSECPLCGKVIQKGDEIVAFTAFLRPEHPLWKYSDAAFHKECFDRSPDKEAVERVHGKFRDIWATRPRHLKKVEEMKAWHDMAFVDFDKEEYGDRQ